MDTKGTADIPDSDVLNYRCAARALPDRRVILRQSDFVFSPFWPLNVLLDLAYGSGVSLMVSRSSYYLAVFVHVTANAISLLSESILRCHAHADSSFPISYMTVSLYS